MRLRIRHAEGMATLSDVKEDQTISILKNSIRNAIGLSDAQDIQSMCYIIDINAYLTIRLRLVSGGYPPKPFNDTNATLTHAGLRDGDTLNIKVLDTVAPQQQFNASTTPSSTVNTLKEGSVQTANGVLQLRVCCIWINLLGSLIKIICIRLWMMTIHVYLDQLVIDFI